MATDRSYVDYALEQMTGAGTLSQRKMFGEYALYCDGKVVALVCDNQLYIKDTDAGRRLLPEVKQGAPFAGAKPWLLGDEWLDDAPLLTKVIRATAAALPLPQTKRARTSKAQPQAKAIPKTSARKKAKTKAKTAQRSLVHKH